MCMSPHEMTSTRIEEFVAQFKALLDNPHYAGDYWKSSRQVWEGALANYEQLLKERAEDGTYDTAGQIDNHTQRTAYQYQ